MDNEQAYPNQPSPDGLRDTRESRISDLEDKVSAGLLDRRQVIQHTFAGTAEEEFLNPIGKLPNGVLEAGKDMPAHITINFLRSTARRIYATSDTPGVTVNFLIF